MTASSTDSSSAAPIGRNLKEFHSVVVLTGAGISAESGVKTFRDNNGLWENHRMEEIATPEGFAANPELVQAFYNARRAQLRQVAPNPAHWALAAFERSFKGNFLLITQNVDDLHGRAGSRNLLHMHGELRKVRCVESHQVFDWAHDIQASDECACCGLSETLRPHIVWFGEMPLFMDEIYRALEECDLFLSIGTSGHVYPAAGFVQVANQSGAHTVEINLEPSQVQGDFGECIYGPASRAVPDFLSSISSAKD